MINKLLMIQADAATAVDTLENAVATASTERVTLWDMAVNGGWIMEGNIDAARNLAKETATPLGRMISKGFSRLGRPLPDIQAAIENEGQLEVANLEKRVSLVSTVASLGR